jgi:hypothetical protein
VNTRTDNYRVTLENGKNVMGSLALGEVDQYLPDQIIAQRGETMGKGCMASQVT